jgi:hypothetical protein
VTALRTLHTRQRTAALTTTGPLRFSHAQHRHVLTDHKQNEFSLQNASHKRHRLIRIHGKRRGQPRQHRRRMRQRRAMRGLGGRRRALERCATYVVPANRNCPHGDHLTMVSPAPKAMCGYDVSGTRTTVVVTLPLSHTATPDASRDVTAKNLRDIDAASSARHVMATARRRSALPSPSPLSISQSLLPLLLLSRSLPYSDAASHATHRPHGDQATSWTQEKARGRSRT